MEVIEVNGVEVGILSVQEMMQRTIDIAKGVEVEWPTLKFFASSIEEAKEHTKIEIGDLAKDRITGFEGVVVGYSTYLHNTDRVDLQPRELKDGAVQKGKGFDVHMLQLLEKHVILAPVPLEHEFKLGDLAKDQLSECQGTITCFTSYISGCTHAVIQPAEMKDGHPVEGIYFPVTQLDLLKASEVAPEAVKPGGPVREARGYLP